MGAGETVNDIDNDSTLSADSSSKLITQAACKGYVDNLTSNAIMTRDVSTTSVRPTNPGDRITANTAALGDSYFLSTSDPTKGVLYFDDYLFMTNTSLGSTDDLYLGCGTNKAIQMRDSSNNPKLEMIDTTGNINIYTGLELDYMTANTIPYLDSSKIMQDLTLSSNLSLITGTLDTIQDIQTTSDVTFNIITPNGGISMPSAQTIDFTNENDDKIIFDGNWLVATNSGNLRIHNYNDTTDYVAFRWGGADRLRIEEDGSDVCLTNPNGNLCLDGGVLASNVNLDNVNTITFQDENNDSKLIYKGSGGTAFRTGVANNWMEHRIPTGVNGYRIQIDEGTDQDYITIEQTTGTTMLRPLICNDDVNISTLTADTLVYGDTSKDLKSATLSSNLTLTTGTLDTVQDIQTTSSPTFSELSTTSHVNVGGDIKTTSDMAIQLNNASADTLLIIQNTDGTYEASLSCEGYLKSSKLSASHMVASDGTKALVSTNLADWVYGTTNQIDVGGTTYAELSLPQDIDTNADFVVGTIQLGGGSGVVASGIIDDDSFTTGVSGTTLASSESIKAYVDSQLGGSGVSAMVRAHNSSTQSNVTGDGTIYTLLYDTEDYDPDGVFASNAYTAPADGYYTFKAYCVCSYTNAVNTNMYTDFCVNGSVYNHSYYTELTGTGFKGVNTTIDLYLSSGDVITTTIVVSGSSKTCDITSQNWFTGYRFK